MSFYKYRRSFGRFFFYNFRRNSSFFLLRENYARLLFFFNASEKYILNKFAQQELEVVKNWWYLRCIFEEKYSLRIGKKNFFRLILDFFKRISEKRFLKEGSSVCCLCTSTWLRLFGPRN